MADFYQPDRRPSLFDLWTQYRFDISLLASTAHVPENTIQAMLGNQPIDRAEAEQVLTHLSALLHKEYSLDTVYVTLSKPVSTHEAKSEVARLMQQIEVEFQSASQGLHGLASGTAQHTFITKRMENIGGLHEQLRELIGDDAMPLIVEKLDQLNQMQQN
jgi:hypothetical protein